MKTYQQTFEANNAYDTSLAWSLETLQKNTLEQMMLMMPGYPRS